MNIKEKWVSWEEFDQLFPGLTSTYLVDFERIGGLTEGSIPFADAAGMLAEYNSGLFFDETNVRLGVGIGAPVCTGHLRAGACADYAGLHPDTVLILEDTDDVTIQFQCSTTGEGRIRFCDDDFNPSAGMIQYIFTDDEMQFGVATSINMKLTSVGLAVGNVAPTNQLYVYGLGQDDGGVATFDCVVARFRNTRAGNHGAISIDALTGYDPILYLAENGTAIWDIRNDASATDNFEIRYQVAAANRTDFRIDNTGNVSILSGDLTMANGSSINLEEDITFTGATGVNLVKFPDDLANALSFMEGANAYLTFTTTDGSEIISLSKPAEISYDGLPNNRLSIIGANTWTESRLDSYNATFNYCGQWKFRRSHSDTLGTQTETEDEDFLGDFWFQGVDNAGNFDRGAGIKCEQDGAAGARVPANLKLETYDDSGKNTNQLLLKFDGKVILGAIPSTDAGDYDLRYDAADGIVYDTSDKRQKKFFKPLNYGLTEILQLQPKRYEYYVGEACFKEDEETERVIGREKIKITKKSKDSFGLVAQDVYDIIPEAVYKPEDDSVAFWGLREKKLIPIMINAIKELNHKIELLEAQLNN